jgi:beta-galactosidase
MGNGPGGLSEYDELIERLPRLHGGFIWEWRDHGLRTRTPEGIEYFGYGGDFGEVVHDGNFVMDGMVLPDDTPTPSVAEFAAVHAPVVLTVGRDELTVRNRYHSADTGHLRFVVSIVTDSDEDPVEHDLDVPVLAPRTSATVPLPVTDAAVDHWLTVRAELAQDAAWASAGHVVARAQAARLRRPVALTLPRPTEGAPAPVGPADPLVLGPAAFDPRTGQLQRLFDTPVAGPRLELWRAPTDNDQAISFGGSYEVGAPEETPFGLGSAAPSSAERWRRRGLDRLVQRQLELVAGPSEVVSRVRVGAANSGLFVEVRYRWQLQAAGLCCFVELEPSVGWDCTWPRVGVRFDLPAEVEQARWFGTGPHESYPDTRTAALTGSYAASVDELNVRYSRPQETGHRAELHRLEVATGSGPVLRLATLPRGDGHRPGFTLSRHTPQQVAGAGHPHELPASERTYLFLDDAVHGVGSRACGIDVLPEHALWPGAHQFGFVFQDPR